ncbi:MAG: hypothetical protein IT367_05975 [Candidatus Hydrogenedentes bacterium]|nr:hypothetical protein [Candidatus Hydrogenedentota bacterium]
MSIDLPPVPPPPMPRPKLNKPVTVIAGCGLGIMSIVVFIVLGFLLLSIYLPNKALPKARLFVDSVYAKAESNKNLTKDQLEVYGEIAKIVRSTESSIFAVNIGGATLYDHLKDGTITDEEKTEAQKTLEEIQKDPSAGLIAMMTYVQAHPEMQKRMTTFQRDMAYQAADAG